MAETHHTTRGRDTNPDPITGEPGAHPVGTGVGAAGGGATGAAIGTAVGGPVGGAVGAVIGAIAGGLAGKGVAEAIDPTAEDAYWREHHRSQTFARKDLDYDSYAPAYRTGFEGYDRHQAGTKFEDVEPTLREHYESGIWRHGSGTGAVGAVTSTPGTTHTTDAIGTPGSSLTGTGQTAHKRPDLPWDEARHAAQAAWMRVERGEAIRVRAEK